MAVRKKKSNDFFGTASIIKRLLALFIDLFIVYFIISRPFFNLFLSFFGNIENLNYSLVMEMLNNDTQLISNLSIILFFVSIMALIYFSYMELKFSQTFGQMIMGLYIKNENKERKAWHYLLNNLFVFPFFPFFILWIIDPLHIFYNGIKYTEKIAGLKMEQKYMV